MDVRKEIHWNSNRHAASRQTYYYPVIEFSAQDKTIRAKAAFKAFRPETFAKGRQLNILYNPKNPYDFKLGKNSLWEGVAEMIFMFMLGAVFMYIAR